MLTPLAACRRGNAFERSSMHTLCRRVGALAAPALLLASLSSGNAAERKPVPAAFENGGEIPSVYTCQGKGVSPPVAWSNVPAAAKAIAITVDDPDAPKGGFVH